MTDPRAESTQADKVRVAWEKVTDHKGAGREATEDDVELELSHAVRLELFLSHPCSGKYGDDGEMQCNRTPFIDFKRDFPSEILAKSMLHRLLLAAQPSVQRDDGISLIQQERRRQIEEHGWTPEHDDTHTRFELAKAAEAYLVAAWAQLKQLDRGWLEYEAGRRWPWGINAMPELNPDPIRNLVKSAALIAAQIEVLQRITAERGSK